MEPSSTPVRGRKGTLEKTGEGDGPTEAAFWFLESQDDIDPYSDSASDRR